MDQAMMTDFKRITVGRKHEQLLRDYGISLGGRRQSQTQYASKMNSVKMAK